MREGAETRALPLWWVRLIISVCSKRPSRAGVSTPPFTYLTALTSRLKSDALMTIIYFAFASPPPPPGRQINYNRLETNSNLAI